MVCAVPKNKQTKEHTVCVVKTKPGQNFCGTNSFLFRALTSVQFIRPSGPMHHDNGTVQWINGSDKLNKAVVVVARRIEYRDYLYGSELEL